jgi:hypothetical protein
VKTSSLASGTRPAVQFAGSFQSPLVRLAQLVVQDAVLLVAPPADDRPNANAATERVASRARSRPGRRPPKSLNGSTVFLQSALEGGGAQVAESTAGRGPDAQRALVRCLNRFG